MPYRAAPPIGRRPRGNPVAGRAGHWDDPAMITIRAIEPDAPDAVALVRSYLSEIVDRYHG
nr:hypothetical protein GCM10020092_088330 [Actinoplanes digitatis]